MIVLYCHTERRQKETSPLSRLITSYPQKYIKLPNEDRPPKKKNKLTQSAAIIKNQKSNDTTKPTKADHERNLFYTSPKLENVEKYHNSYSLLSISSQSLHKRGKKTRTTMLYETRIVNNIKISQHQKKKNKDQTLSSCLYVWNRT